jgi:hypothetical protein
MLWKGKSGESARKGQRKSGKKERIKSCREKEAV